MSKTGRIEAFSDGVFAIAITLLILEIKVPHVAGKALGAALLEEWPSYIAFLASFFTIGVMWMNHRRLFDLIDECDETLTFINLILLLGVTWIPFPTAVLATYLTTENDRLAGVVYASSFLAIAIVFQFLQRHVARLARAEKHEHAAHIRRQYWWGPLLYVAAILIALVSGTACLIWSALLGVYFALPPRLVARRP